jgi:dimethylamine--corrinoid protein Co-methyltransferase
MGTAISHALASGMGGIRTAGDLVARMQMIRGMKLNEAKEYVANKLGVSIFDLSDEIIMEEIRESLNIGKIRTLHHHAKGMEAKFRIAKLLDIEINSVNRFKKMIESG